MRAIPRGGARHGLKIRVSSDRPRPWALHRADSETEHRHGNRFTPDPFWRLIDTSAGTVACWPWTGYRDRDGYGRHVKGKRAHRIACEAAHGAPPFPGARVLHSCDNPPCCNPKHLSWGTQRRNVLDSIERGSHYVPRRGARKRPEGSAKESGYQRALRGEVRS